MMYEFIDTTEQSGALQLPAEALQINGEYIEHQIEGYRTLSVQGREALSAEVTTDGVGLRPGSVYMSRKYPERVITVRYQLIAETPEKFREAYNRLAAILDVEESQLIFNDEPDKYFIGIPGALEAVEPGRNAVVSTISFVCPDPFKYSVTEYEADLLQDGTLYCEYNGTFPAHPKLSAQFLQEGDVTEEGEASTITGDGDCGYIAFFDEDEHILQFGDPEEADGEDMEATQTLLAAALCSSTAWTSAVTAKWSTNAAAAAVMSGATKSGSAGMVPFASNADPATQYYVGPTSYGSASGWHGPVISAAIPEDANGVTGAENFMFEFKLKAAITGLAEGPKQFGGVYCFLTDANGNKLYGLRVFKGTAGTTGRIWWIVNGSQVATETIDMSYNGKYFGSNRKQYYKTVGKKKVLVPAITTNKVVRFTKTSNSITISAGGISKTFACSNMAAVTRISIQFMQCGTRPALSWLGIYSWKFDKLNCDTWKEVPNKFTAGDLLEIDGSDGTVLLNGNPTPGLGALGNDWEELVLQPGENNIGHAYSDWCESPPTVGMTYREVYL